MEQNETQGCLIMAVIGFFGLLLIGTFIASDINPEAETAMTIIGTIIIGVAVFVIYKVSQ
jgi:hypothetical protein